MTFYKVANVFILGGSCWDEFSSTRVSIWVSEGTKNRGGKTLLIYPACFCKWIIFNTNVNKLIWQLHFFTLYQSSIITQRNNIYLKLHHNSWVFKCCTLAVHGYLTTSLPHPMMLAYYYRSCSSNFRCVSMLFLQTPSSWLKILRPPDWSPP